MREEAADRPKPERWDRPVPHSPDSFEDGEAPAPHCAWFPDDAGLRDRFAEAALRELMRGRVMNFGQVGGGLCDELARDAYAVADAMLRARAPVPGCPSAPGG